MNWCTDDLNTFSSVSERDIDLILVEELRCSEPFRKSFLTPMLEKIRIKSAPATGSVFHSVSRTGESSGETDLLLTFSDGGRTFGIIIENKIDAVFSDRVKSGIGQIKRHQIERDSKVSTKQWSAGGVVLVAPQNYLSKVDSAAFDAFVSYEDIVRWLARPVVDPELICRLDHKRQMFRAAIQRHRRSWERKADSGRSFVWGHYEQIATEPEFVALKMHRPGREPADSYSVRFDWIAERSYGIARLSAYHVMDTGNVDILLGGYADRAEAVFLAVKSILPDGLVLRPAQKSLGINIRVDPISTSQDLKSQSSAIRAGLNAMRKLREWFEKNNHLIPKH